jgi:DNA-binding CsgD family transcriptional regulator
MGRDTAFDRLLKEIPDPEYDELTPLEEQIIKMVAEGASDATIAIRLQISEPRIKLHLATIYKKLSTHTMGGAPTKPFPKTTDAT